MRMYFFSLSSLATGPKIRVSLGVAVVVDDDCCIIVEADVGTVSAADFLLRSDDYGLDNVALLYVAVGRGFANRSDYNVADCTDFAEAAALYLNAENLARAGIIRNVVSKGGVLYAAES